MCACVCVQVYLNYGDRPAEHYLSFYGFAPRRNPFDRVALRHLPLLAPAVLARPAARKKLGETNEAA